MCDDCDCSAVSFWKYVGIGFLATLLMIGAAYLLGSSPHILCKRAHPGDDAAAAQCELAEKQRMRNGDE